MKHLLLFIGIFFISTSFAFGMTNNEYLSTIETKLFNQNYESQQINLRLDRIEKEIYGKKFNTTETARIKNIQKIYPLKQGAQSNTITQLKELPIPPPTQKTATQKNKKTDTSSKIKKTGYNSYPIVTQMEKIKFNQTYESEDIYLRLSRLEKKVYSRVSKAELSERVDNLKNAIMPQKATQNNDDEYFDQNPADYNSAPNNTGNNFDFNSDPNNAENNSDPNANQAYDQSSLIMLNQVLSEIETKLFSQTYSNETPETRVSRIETKLFNSTSPEESMSNRLERINAVITAEKSSPIYRNAKNMQWLPILFNILIIGLSFI